MHNQAAEDIWRMAGMSVFMGIKLKDSELFFPMMAKSASGRQVLKAHYRWMATFSLTLLRVPHPHPTLMHPRNTNE